MYSLDVELKAGAPPFSLLQGLHLPGDNNNSKQHSCSGDGAANCVIGMTTVAYMARLNHRPGVHHVHDACAV